eukprot:754997-Amphidinium_carterae.1
MQEHTTCVCVFPMPQKHKKPQLLPLLERVLEKNEWPSRELDKHLLTSPSSILMKLTYAHYVAARGALVKLMRQFDHDNIVRILDMYPPNGPDFEDLPRVHTDSSTLGAQIAFH